MPPIPLRSAPKPLHLHRSHLHTTPHPQASILFALGALSNSRETQHLNHLSRLPRSDHSPNLHLIKTSQVDPFPIPSLTSEGKEIRLYTPWQQQQQRQDARRVVNVEGGGGGLQDVATWQKHGEKDTSEHDQALAVGRAILADIARERGRMRRVVEMARRRSARKDGLLQREREVWVGGREELRAEIRRASVLVVGAVAVATGLGLYVFWPGRVGDAVLGGRVAEKVRGGMDERVVTAGAGAVPASVVVATGEPSVAPAGVVAETSSAVGEAWSWRSLFWKT